MASLYVKTCRKSSEQQRKRNDSVVPARALSQWLLSASNATEVIVYLWVYAHKTGRQVIYNAGT